MLGLKHIPIPLDSKDSTIRKAFVKFKHSTLWKVYFRENFLKAEIQSQQNNLKLKPFNIKLKPIKTGTHFCTELADNHPIHDIFSKFGRSLNRYLKFNPTRYTFNATHRIIKKLKLQHPSIIFKATDKNLGFCALDLDHYNELVLTHLNDTNTYLKYSEDDLPNEHLEGLLRREFYEFIITQSHFWTDDERTYLNSWTDFKIPHFHVLPKIHKPGPLSSRPIAGALSWITTPISIILDIRLQATLSKYPQILLNSQDLVSDIEQFQFTGLPSNFKLITGDIITLYPNIDVALMFTIIKKLEPSLLPLFEFISNHSFVSFNDLIYKQISGIAMGSNCSVSIANLYLAEILDRHISSHPQVFYFKRYIDDLIIIWLGTAFEWLDFTGDLSQIHETLNFTWSTPDTKAIFLDIKIFLDPILFRLDTCVFQKQLNKYLYISRKSCHPPHVFAGFIKGELTRYARLSTNAHLYLATKTLLWKRLVTRGYSTTYLSPLFRKHNWISRFEPIAPRTSNLLPFILPYNLRPNLSDLTKLCHEFKTSFAPFLPNSELLLSFSRPANLNDLLTSSKLTFDQSLLLL